MLSRIYNIYFKNKNEKFYTSLGLMSGTSMDGVDASIIRSDGESDYEPIFDKYFEYDGVIYSNLLNLRDKINSIKDIKANSYQINELERKITLFHAKISKEIIKNAGVDAKGVLRAIINNISNVVASRRLEGASTITQQVGS